MSFLFKNIFFNTRTVIGFSSIPFSVNQKNISTISENSLLIRPLKLLEFEQVIKKWSKREGWNPGIYEYLPFYNACQNGHKGLFSKDNQLLASLSAIRYAKDFAFLGIFIVDPNHRERGVGEILARTVLAELEDCSLMGLNGVKQQVGNYQRKYDFIPSHTNLRLSGKFRAQACQNFFFGSEEKIKVIGGENIDINQLIDYDASVFSYVREAFLRTLIEMPESYLLAATEKAYPH